jgi:hypothetical protein
MHDVDPFDNQSAVVAATQLPFAVAIAATSASAAKMTSAIGK